MEWVLVIIQLLPYVFKLIKIVEKIFDKPESGNQKKDVVMAAAMASVDNLRSDAKAKVADTMSDIIDATVSYLYPHEEATNGQT